MPNKLERQRQKELQIRNVIKRQERGDFDKKLPMENEKYKQLIDYLDNKLSENACDHTYKMTKAFLKKIGQNNIENILEWLANNAGSCDCEILDRND
jgi:hypothetical protein